MSTAPAVPAPDLLAPAAAPRAARRTLTDIPPRLAGVAAMGFAGLVVVQNIVRGSSAPANDASGQEVLTYYATHRTTTAVLVATFVVCATALAVFLGAAMRRFLAASRPGWAITGCIGAVGVMALFGLTVASEQSLLLIADNDRPSVSSVETLWALHNSVFTVLLMALAVALLGLGRAGVAAGLTPRAFEIAAPLGAAGLAIGAMAGPEIAAGDAMPLFGLSGLGFLVWLSFLATTGYRLFRGER